ncbi:MAG TPA: YfhO family protein, partial [Thermoanaerobaculia bacterium]|nr:YfhO family protein [Thermoanaerobaculia bacterium]
MHIDGKLCLALALALALTQAACWLLARGLKVRLGRWVVLGGLSLPILLLAPWLDGSRLLVPCDLLARQVPWAPGLPPGSELDRHDLLNDSLFQFLPWELEIRHALAAHRLPFWSDVLEGGSSPWANPQAGVLSPLQMPARLLPIQHHLLGALALKLLVAFEGTWLLARRVGRSRQASFLAAASFALGGGMLSWALFPHTAAAAWVPWLAVGVLGLFRRPTPLGVVTTAVLTAALLLSGHPEVAAIGGLFVAILGLALRRRALGLARGVGAAALAAVLGLGLAAPHVFPFLALLPDSQRAHETLAQGLPLYHFELASPGTWFLPGHAGFVLSPTNPRAFGRPFVDDFKGPVNWVDAESGYTGLVALAGALIALLAGRDRRAWPFLAFAALGLLLAARFLPFAHILYGVRPLRVPAYERFLLIGCLALSIAAAFGFDRLLRSRRTEIPAVLAGLAAAAALSLAVHADGGLLALWGGILAAVLGATFLRLRHTAAWLLGIVLLCDLVPWGRSLLPQGHPGLFYPQSPVLADVEREVATGGPWRAVGAEYLVYPSLLPFYGVAEVRPHNPLAPMPYLAALGAAFEFRPSMVRYFSALRNVDHPLLDFLNVRVVVGSVAMPPSRRLVPIDDRRYAPFFLYRNPTALPRWFIPDGFEILDRSAGRSAGERFVAGMRDPARVGLFADELGDWRPAALPVRAQALSARTEVPGHLILTLPAAAGPGGTLVATSIPYSRGWRAWSGGRPLSTLTVDGAFLGVRVPPQTARLELRFRPPGLVAGVVFFSLALLGGLVLLARPRRGSGLSLFSVARAER